MARRAETGARPDVAPVEQGGDGGIRSVVPQISVVLCTYNRAERVAAAVRAILDQHGADLELVVVDDGSTDGTPAALAAIDDARMRVVRRANGGLSAARNSGLAAVTAPWVVFIDDDDTAQPGWLAAFVAQGADDTVGIACCGAQFVDVDGNDLFTRPPVRLGPPFGDLVASTLAGTFAVRTDLARRAGGYLDGLGTRHQTELFIRLLALAGPAGLRVSTVPELLIHIEGRLATDRPGVNPRRLYDGTRWIIARHPRSFAGQPQLVGLFEGVVGTNAARLGDWRAARRHLRRAVRATPGSREAWGRLALASVPPLADRVWNRHGDWATHDPTEVGVLRQLPPRLGADGPATADELARADLAEAPPARRELFLAWRYEENPPLPHTGDDVAAGPATDGGTRAGRRWARTQSGDWPSGWPAGEGGGRWSRWSATLTPPPRPPTGDALGHRPGTPRRWCCATRPSTGSTTPWRCCTDSPSCRTAGRSCCPRPTGPPPTRSGRSGPRPTPATAASGRSTSSSSSCCRAGWMWSTRGGWPASAPASWAERLAARAPWLPIPGVRRDTLVVLAAHRSVATPGSGS